MVKFNKIERLSGVREQLRRLSVVRCDDPVIGPLRSFIRRLVMGAGPGIGAKGESAAGGGK